MHANDTYTCFYEGWCTEREIRAAPERIKRLVAGIASIIGERDG